jgi:hypothetical protein
LIWLANDEDLHADYLGTDDPSIDAQKIEEILWYGFPDLKLDLFPQYHSFDYSSET